MSFGALLFVIGAALLQPGAPANGQSPRAPDCTDWRECRQMVETALETGELDRAAGPRLARGAAWSQGRPGAHVPPGASAEQERPAPRCPCHDPAAGGTRRPHGRGHAPRSGADACAAGLARGRRVGGACQRRGARPAHPASTGAGQGTGRHRQARSSSQCQPVHSGSAAADAALGAGEVLRFSGARFVAAGLAYDAVSHRFVIGDRDGRKLQVVGVGLDHAVDLVRAESAGFFDVQALDIDTRRGDLWVVSADETGSCGCRCTGCNWFPAAHSRPWPLAATCCPCGRSTSR